MSLKSLLIGAVMIAAAGASPAHANLLTNGSFETGDFTGWNLTGDQGLVSVQNGTTFPYTTGPASGNVSQGAQEGSYYVYEGPIGSNALLSQTFNDTPGQTLTISGWVTGAGPGVCPCSSNVSFLFNGVALPGGVVDPVPDQIWTQYVFTATATGNDTFAVGFRDDSSFDGLDNFSVASISAVPEPGTWALLLLGFTGLGFLRYRRRGDAEATTS